MIKIRDRPGINLKILLVLLVLILGLVGFAFKVEGATGVPKIIHLQGRLLDANSNLLGGTSGTNYCFRFSIYTDATVGAPDTQLWPSSTPSSTTASVKNGVFNVGVGDTAAGGNTLDYNFQDNDTVYLNIEVATLVGATCAAGDGAESYENVSPRQQITSSGYAINASTVGGFTPSQYASGTQIAVLNSGNLSLGGTNPQINATGTNTLTLQGGGGTGNIQFFSASNTISSAGALTLAGAITTTGLTINTLTSGSLLFAGAGGAVSQSSTVLYWDNVNGRLGIGNNSPSSTLHITGTGRFSSALTLDNGLTLTTGALNLTATSGAVSLTLSSSTTAFNINGLFDVDTTNNRIGIGTTAPSTTLHVIGTITGTSLNASSAVLSGLTSGSLLFAGTGGAVSESSTVLYWDNVNGRLGIGTNAPSTTLDIIGAGRLNTTSTTAFQIQSSSTGLTFDSVNNRLGLGISTPSTPLHIVKSVSAFSATGGTITTSGIYTIHTFTTSGTFTPNGSIDTEVLVVAGGGGGGNLTGAYNTGGGGAGGIVYDSVHAVTAQAYTVTVGAGGAANTNGQDSVFDDITAIGGGHAATNGGSGGGNGGLATQGASGGEVGYGSNGGAGGSNGGGGGGGAGAAGQGNQGNGLGGVGGDGVAFSISGTSTYYGGGGGGNGSGNVPAGGLGGGGTGRTPTAGTANTGGGGGGYYTSGAAGGSGIVIIRYITPSENFTEGQRLGADTSNYGKFEIGQYGSLKISAVGTNPSITLTPGGTGFTILNGNVGIGTTSPLSTLHVSGTALFGPGTASTTAFRVISSSTLPVFNVDTINNRIGINTNSPSTTLDIIGAGRLNTTSTTAFQIQSSSTGLTFDSVNNWLGIGTATPTTALDVIGAGRLSVTSTTALQIVASNTVLVFDSHNARLSVGTSTSLAAALTVHGGLFSGDTSNLGRTVYVGNTSTYPGIWLGQSAPSLTNFAFLGDATNGNIFNTPSGKNIYFRVGNANKVFLESTGEVGIGNVAPSSTLDITGSLGVAGSSTFVGPVSLFSQRTLTADSATPSASVGSHFVTANTVPTTITNFTSGINGQLLTVKVGDNNTTFKCVAATSLDCGTTDISAVASDTLTFIYDGTTWNLISWMKSSAAQTGADIAELFPSQENLEPGDIVAVDIGKPVHVVKSTSPYSRKAIGIVATKPGIVLGEGEITDRKTYPIALAGRVPVKVTAENGPINIGDFITTSSAPGVGMKAVRAGQAIGQALSPFDGSGIGTITVFVNIGYFSGLNPASLPSGLTDLSISSVDSGKQILLQLINHQGSIGSVDMSEIIADRVVAGLEVITPRVITKELITDSIEALPGNDLRVTLADASRFVIAGVSASNTSPASAVVSFDSSGNAFFAGEIKAGSISANKISGLEIITDRISSLSNTVQDLVITEGNGSSTVSVKGGLTVKGDASFGEVRAMNIFAESIDSPSLDLLKESINRIASTTERIEQEAASSSQAIDALTARLDFLENQQKVSLDSSLAENGGLSIDEISIFKGGLQVNNISAIDNEIAFMSDVVFFGRPYFTTDTAGFGVILQGEKEVKVTFEKEYIEKPVVSATISLDEVVAGSSLEEMILSGDLHYIVTRVSIKGFTILIDKPAPTDIQFSWTALAVKNPKTFFSLKGEEPAAPTASEVSPESSSSTQIEVVSSSTEPIATPPESSTEASSSVEAPPVQTDSSSTETLPPPTIEEPSLPAPSEPLTDSSGTVSG